MNNGPRYGKRITEIGMLYYDKMKFITNIFRFSKQTIQQI